MEKLSFLNLFNIKFRLSIIFRKEFEGSRERGVVRTKPPVEGKTNLSSVRWAMLSQEFTVETNASKPQK